MDRQESAEPRVDYRALLEWGEDQLYSNLSDPHGREKLPRRVETLEQRMRTDPEKASPHGSEKLPQVARLDAALGYSPDHYGDGVEMAAFASQDDLEPRILREPRRKRIEEHRYAACYLRIAAEREQDQARREKYERAAQLHDAFVQALEAVAFDPSMSRILRLKEGTLRDTS